MPNELDKALQKSKNGKSAGPDLICNEMLKYGGESLHLAILALFNSILRDGKYPDKWKDSFITPIHKGSDIHKAENYRGVAVADCISKIFCSIMNARIVNHLEERSLWKLNQNGFREGRRTEDNIMIIKTLFISYVKKKKQRLFMGISKYSSTTLALGELG